MISDRITFAAADDTSDNLRCVEPTEVSTAQVVRVDGGYQLIATLKGSAGSWRMSSPGGLADTLQEPELFGRFIEVVLPACHAAARRLAA